VPAVLPADDQFLRTSSEGLKLGRAARCGSCHAKTSPKRGNLSTPMLTETPGADSESEGAAGPVGLEHLRISTPARGGADDDAVAAPRCSCKNAHLPVHVTLAPSCTLWSALEKMRAKELHPNFKRGALPRWGPRGKCIDWLLQLGRAFELSSFTVHVGVSLLDRFLQRSGSEPSAEPSQLPLLVTSCLKLADVYSEISKEYYKQDNAKEYADMKDEYPPSFAPASDRTFGAVEIVAQEKTVLKTLGFDMHVPTVFWFTSTYLCIAGFEEDGPARLISQFLADLALLDAEMQTMRASIVAQACVVLGVYFSTRSVPGASVRTDHEQMCDDALAQWMLVRDLVRSDEAKEGVEMQMCWIRLLHVVTVARREWKLEELQAVEARHSPAALKLSYPSTWPTFLIKYLVRELDHRIPA